MLISESCRGNTSIVWVALLNGFSHMTDLTVLAKSHYGDVIMGAMASQTTSLTLVYSIVYSDADQRKHKISASLAFVWGIHRWPVNSPHKGSITLKMFPFDDVIMLFPKPVCGNGWISGVVFSAIAWEIITPKDVYTRFSHYFLFSLFKWFYSYAHFTGTGAITERCKWPWKKSQDQWYKTDVSQLNLIWSQTTCKTAMIPNSSDTRIDVH